MYLYDDGCMCGVGACLSKNEMNKVQRGYNESTVDELEDLMKISQQELETLAELQRLHDECSFKRNRKKYNKFKKFLDKCLDE